MPSVAPAAPADELAAFLAWLRDWPPGKAIRAVFIGGRECGKTHWSNYVVSLLAHRDPRARVVIWTPQPEARFDALGALEVPSVTAAAQLAARAARERRPEPRVFLFRAPVPFAHVAAYALRLREIDPEAPVILVIDELADPEVTVNGQWVSKDMIRLLQISRHVHLIGGSQRPTGMPHSMRELAHWYFIFSVTQDDALKRLADDRVPRAKLRRVLELRDREFVICRVGRERDPEAGGWLRRR